MSKFKDKLLKECKAYLRDLLRACAMAGIADIQLLFTDLSRWPELDNDASTNYAVGYFNGVADALEQPVFDLLNEVVSDE